MSDEQDRQLYEMQLRDAIEYWTPKRVKEAVSFGDELTVNNEYLPSSTEPTCGVTVNPHSTSEPKSPDPAEASETTEPSITAAAEQEPSITAAAEQEPSITAAAEQEPSITAAAEQEPSITAAAEQEPSITAAAEQEPQSIDRRRAYVKDSYLKELPYKSVGKVYAQFKSKKNEKCVDMKVTAFYIGQPKEISDGGALFHRLLTVAHAFDNSEYKSASLLLFAPASNPNLSKDKYCFLVSDKWQRHPGYVTGSGEATNDVCVLFVWPWAIQTERRIDIILSPLKLAVNKFFNEADVWMIIGYPKEGDRQYYVKGSYIPYHLIEDKVTSGEMTIWMDSSAKPGMSGGPWICQHPENEEFMVIGIQSHVSFLRKSTVPAISISPHFTDKMFEFLDLKVHYRGVKPSRENNMKLMLNN